MSDLKVLQNSDKEAKMITCKRSIAGLLLLITFYVSVGAQSKTEFDTFWEKFKAAVIKGDKNTVASLTQFPLSMSYGIRSIKSKPELLRRYREVFNQQTDGAKCFGAKSPEKDEANAKRYSVACPNEAGEEVVIYAFQRGKLGWRFVGLDNLNE